MQKLETDSCIVYCTFREAKMNCVLRDLHVGKRLIEVSSEFFLALAEFFGNSVQHQRFADLEADLLEMEADRKTTHDLKMKR